MSFLAAPTAWLARYRARTHTSSMSDETQQYDMTNTRVVYRVKGMDEVAVRRDVEFPAADSGLLTFDLYVRSHRVCRSSSRGLDRMKTRA